MPHHIVTKHKWWQQVLINPFTAPACQLYRLKSADIHACKTVYLMSPVTNILSISCVLIEVLSCAHAKEAKKPEWFQIWHFTGCFPNDGMAVKGLIKAAGRACRHITFLWRFIGHDVVQGFQGIASDLCITPVTQVLSTFRFLSCVQFYLSFTVLDQFDANTYRLAEAWDKAAHCTHASTNKFTHSSKKNILILNNNND